MASPAPRPDAPAPAARPSRTVVAGDGVAWLRAAGRLPPDHAVVTSLPDAAELPGLRHDAWRAWFSDAAALVCATVADDAVAVFFQSDVLRDGRWVDKGALVSSAAERAGAACVFHKVVCRVPAGTPSAGRPGWAHLLAFSRGLRARPALATPDVLPALGAMSWPRAMGVAACEAVVAFLRAQTRCRVVVDPFCGPGTMLAVANAHGLDAVGVECVRRRAAAARRLVYEVGAGFAS
ncbi:MAG: SAM-dependent methyltransferase [Planctomycetes bacterium]|nr:SAM-dependent methyltransferase [Planctomycetota bacterium]